MKHKIIYEPSVKVYEKVSKQVSEVVDGQERTKVVFEDVDISTDDYIKDLPRFEEYSLSNLLAAGVPLEQMNVQGLLAGNLATTLDRVEQGNHPISAV